MVQSIAHIALVVRDYDAVIAFYVSCLVMLAVWALIRSIALISLNKVNDRLL